MGHTPTNSVRLLAGGHINKRAAGLLAEGGTGQESQSSRCPSSSNFPKGRLATRSVELENKRVSADVQSRKLWAIIGVMKRQSQEEKMYMQRARQLRSKAC
ncbi:unnamed protein product [Protopolystoma xenopodis]|uniref:Uncharacterized protein n=1 Tax=Protopolystoma xenopodis TaxID=117903 RepID=A0A3S5B0S4_9PLAT|nr:unnamed protein product [Protopolystoma xenopodis]